MALVIADLEIDAEVSSEHVDENEVTEHPVERGADVTDNVRARPKMLVVEGVVSDTPIGPIADRRVAGGSPSADAYAHLQTVNQAREPITIQTSLTTYENMVMQSLSVTRDANTGRALAFRATFKQVILVTNNRTTIRVSLPRATKKVNLGNKAAKPAPAGSITAPPAGLGALL